MMALFSSRKRGNEAVAALLLAAAWLTSGLSGMAALRAGEREDLNAAFANGFRLAATADYPAAAVHYERALALAPRVFGPEDLNTAMVQNNLAALYFDMGQYAKAEPLYLRSLKIREDKLGFDHLEVASSLNNLANLYGSMGQYAKAEPLYQRSLKIREAKLGVDHLDVAESLNNLATFHKDRGQYAKAEALLRRSLKIREAKLGAEHTLVAASLHNLAGLYFDMAQYAAAEPLYQRSLKIHETKLGSDHPHVAVSLLGLAELYRAMGQYQNAEPLYHRSLTIGEAKLSTDHPDLAYVLNGLAALYDETGQYAKAEPVYQRSLKIREAKLGATHPDVAASLNNLAELYVDMGQFAKAELLLQRSLKMTEAELGTDHPDVAGSLFRLAKLYWAMGQYPTAEPLVARSLKIYEAKFGADHPDVAASLNALAELYRAMRQYARAEPLYQRSLEIGEARLGSDHPHVAHSLNNLALFYVYKGDYDTAERHYQRGLKIYEAKFGSDHPHVARSLNHLAVLYSNMGQTDKAADQFDRARRVVRRHVAEVLPVLSEREQLEFLNHVDQEWLHGALTLGLQHPGHTTFPEQSAGWLLNGKAVAQQSLAEGALLARDNADPSLAEKIKKLLVLRTELASLSLAVPMPGQEADHRRKLAELSGAEQELARQVHQAADRPAHDSPWIEPAAVRATLADDAVLIDIVRFRPCTYYSKENETRWEAARYVAWVIPPARKGNVEIVDLGAADAIDQAVASARQAIEQSATKIRKADDEEAAEQAVLSPLAKLGEMVLEPLKRHLVDANQLILSPDSNLWLVPWAALPVDEETYAIEAWQIRYVTSGRELVTEQLVKQSSKRNPHRPYVFADPDFDLDDKASLAATRAVLRGQETQLALRSATGRPESGFPKVERLPATAVEARMIAPALEQYAQGSPTIYSGQYALEGVLKLVKSPRVLVLSTHGYYLPDQEVKPEDARKGLTSPDSETKHSVALTVEGKPLENPLLRCGLLLAGCNRPPSGGVDDGVVTGVEIVGCDLRGTDLVVLSACQTGLGQVRNGEGVAGLRQAIQLAGARAVVSTLWRIPDAETAGLMSDFFGNLAAEQSKAEALRNAQLAQIKARRHATGAAHPFFWAAFTITGN